MKKELRKKGLELRNQMSKEEVSELSNQIINQIKIQVKIDKYETLAFYMPLGNEVDLRALMQELIYLGKTVVIPKVHDRYSMDFYEIKDISDVHVGKYGVLEPNCNKKKPKNEIDIIFIPGIYFSYKKYRLGFGAGYYDRFLNDYINQKIGICYSNQIIPNFETDSHDIKMDYLITENPSHLHHDVD